MTFSERGGHRNREQPVYGGIATVLEARIELWNRNTGEITFLRTRARYNRWTSRHIPGAPKTMKLTGNTSDMLRHYVGNRKKGHIFINGRTGKRLTLRHFEKMIDKWARLLNIRKRSVHQDRWQGVSSLSQ